MIYTAKQTTPEIIEGQYELFVEEKATSVDGEEVIILKSIGQHSLADLENQKKGLLNSISEIDAKIEAIKSL